jgi:pimeloyl-ACP methyl ester carboxylesterase
MWVAAKYPERVTSLSLHDGWTKTDPFLKNVVEGWQLVAKAVGSVPEMVTRMIFPWCFTPDLYAAKPEYVQALVDFVHSQPAQPLQCFIQQSNAVLAHDVESQLGRISAPTQVTFGRYDLLTFPRFADRMKGNIRNAELVVFEDCAHAPLYEKTEEFNHKTLEFLQHRAAAHAA